MSETEVAVKLEPTDVDNPKLHKEWKVYQALAKRPHSVGFPQVHFFGLDRGYRALVLSLQGPSLGELLAFCGPQFSVKTVCMLAIRIVSLLQTLHDVHYIHRDIKPENIVIGLRDPSIIYLIDFGLSTEYRDPHSYIHFPNTKPAGRPGLIGTPRYLSINGHQGIQLSRRDDLESLAYVLIYLLHGSLPWQGLESTPSSTKKTLIRKKKLSTTSRQLCYDIPVVFRTFLDYTRHLAFDEMPNYQYIILLFQHALHSIGYTDNGIFDWMAGPMEKSDDSSSTFLRSPSGDASSSSASSWSLSW
ncbi:hypothetical protein H0H92_007583 [Tricholoma furcatifolium]|nr:hypothetical protein H0H92_007583 [Tricholoma furcatifolium]